MGQDDEAMGRDPRTSKGGWGAGRSSKGYCGPGPTERVILAEGWEDLRNWTTDHGAHDPQGFLLIHASLLHVC